MVLIEETLDKVGSSVASERFGASKALRILSEQDPDAVYPHFGFFVRLLDGTNQILKWDATLTLANLAGVDREGKLDRMLDSYLAPIAGPNMVGAANVIRGAAVIAAAKPHLAPRIAARILDVEHATYATAECRNVAIGRAIVALDGFFTVIDDKKAVLEFVRRQVRNRRPATRAKAQKFLRRWGGCP